MSLFYEESGSTAPAGEAGLKGGMLPQVAADLKHCCLQNAQHDPLQTSCTGAYLQVGKCSFVVQIEEKVEFGRVVSILNAHVISFVLN